jgi:hypothetical protein
MKLYGVKLNENHKARTDQVYNGWLGENQIELYTRGEAIKKAKAFGGSIKHIGRDYTIKTFNVLHLSKTQIHQLILNELKGWETYTNTENIEEPMFSGDVFAKILESIIARINGKNNLIEPIALELNVLNQLCSNFEYVIIGE